MSVFVGATPALRIYRGATQLWSAYPDRIFQAQAGLLLDPSRLASLYQDQAGSQPVTEAGQPVGLIRDQSGGGRHASQAISAARPTYRIDAGGRPYLEFDGIDDFLASLPAPLGASGRTVIAGFRKRSDATLGLVVESGSIWNGAPGGFALFAPSFITAGGNMGSRAMPNAAQSILHSPASYPAPMTAVMTATSAAGSHVLRISGQVVGTASPSGPMASLTAPIYIGARNGNQTFAAIDLYALLVIDSVLVASELVKAETWVASKCGVAL